ncbi:MAG: hypothetical protein HC843_04385 [Sphingomonadales bacterium]|nr:hypothetical protein [Sphingomonadales bacterium]
MKEKPGLTYEKITNEIENLLGKLSLKADGKQVHKIAKIIYEKAPAAENTTKSTILQTVKPVQS